MATNSGDFAIYSGANGKTMGTDAGYTLRADFNRDGMVNAADFTILSANYTTSTSVPAGAISEVGNTIGYAGYVWDTALGGGDFEDVGSRNTAAQASAVAPKQEARVGKPPVAQENPPWHRWSGSGDADTGAAAHRVPLGYGAAAERICASISSLREGRGDVCVKWRAPEIHPWEIAQNAG